MPSFDRRDFLKLAGLAAAAAVAPGSHSGAEDAPVAEGNPDSPGLTLFHCHQQLHMDFGFMTLLRYG